MKFLPAENIIYKTRLKPKEIIKRLADSIEPAKTFRFRLFGSNSAKAYEGQINGQAFEIKRIINYRNSFLPRITGSIEQEYDGTTVKVKMRLHVLVLGFLCIWCCVVGFFCISILSFIVRSREFSLPTLIPFGMLLFAYVLTLASFKYESKKSKKDFEAMLETEAIEE